MSEGLNQAGPERVSVGQGADPSHLRLLAALLALPEEGALEALTEVLPNAPWLESAWAELEALPLEEWQAEHTRLFINGYPRTPCPPFESAYRQKQMGGPAVGDLAELYARAGLEASQVPADYLGTQLECMAYLQDIGSEPDAGGACLAEGLRRDLWDHHLSQWLPRFASDLEKNAKLVIYRALGARLGALAQVRRDGR